MSSDKILDPISAHMLSLGIAEASRHDRGEELHGGPMEYSFLLLAPRLWLDGSLAARHIDSPLKIDHGEVYSHFETRGSLLATLPPRPSILTAKTLLGTLNYSLEGRIMSIGPSPYQKHALIRLLLDPSSMGKLFDSIFAHVGRPCR